MSPSARRLQPDGGRAAGHDAVQIVDAPRERQLRQAQREVDLAEAHQRDRDLQERRLPLLPELLLGLSIALATSRAPPPRTPRARCAAARAAARARGPSPPDRPTPAPPGSRAGTPGCARTARRDRVGDAGHGGDLVGPRGEQLRQRAEPGRHQLVDHERLQVGDLLQQRAHDDRLAAIALAFQRERARQAAGERRVRRQQRVARGPVTSVGCPGSSVVCSAPTNPSSAATSAVVADLRRHRAQRLQRRAPELEPARLRLAPAHLHHRVADRRDVRDRQLLERLAQGGVVEGAGRPVVLWRGGALGAASSVAATRRTLLFSRARSIARSSEPPVGPATATGARATGAGAPGAGAAGLAEASRSGERDAAAAGVAMAPATGAWTLPRGGLAAGARGRSRDGARGGSGGGGGDLGASGARAGAGAAAAVGAFGAGALGGVFGGDSAALPSSPRRRSREKMLMLPPDSDLLHRPLGRKTLTVRDARPEHSKLGTTRSGSPRARPASAA